LPGNALVFTYRGLNRFFHALAERTFAGTITYCSSWPGLEAESLQRNFYKYYRDAPSLSILSTDEFEEIIQRSCVLRLLPWQQSKRMVRAMATVIDELTERARPDYLLSVTVDNYMTDLLVRICDRKGVKLLPLAAGSLPRTITLSARGEFTHVRDAPPSQVDAALDTFLDERGRVTYHYRYKPGYSLARHLKVWGTWWAKCLAFKTAGLVLRDPLNFRFLMGSLRARDGQSSLLNYRCTRYFDPEWESALRRSDRPPLLVPLNYAPESTVQYWLRDLRYVEYEDFMVDACRQLGGSFLLLVKEHWSALGVRPRQFYEKMAAVPGVVMVPPEVNSRHLMSLVENVLVGAGTTGVEAAVRGKKVATLSRPYYYLEGHYLDLGSADRLCELPRLLGSFSPPPPTRENQRRVVARMLQATLEGHLLPDAYIDTEENYLTAARSLREYLLRPSEPRRAAPAVAALAR